MNKKLLVKKLISIIDNKFNTLEVNTINSILDFVKESTNFLECIGLGINENGEYYTVSRSLPPVCLPITTENPGIRLRKMTESSLMLLHSRYPDLSGNTNKVILMPLPSLLYRGEIKKIKEFFKGWIGVTYFTDGIPYCIFTVAR